MPASSRKKARLSSGSDYEHEPSARQSTLKSRRTTAKKTSLVSYISSKVAQWPRVPVRPGRLHPPSHHRPRLLDDGQARSALLAWFEGVSSKRQMPWRQDWIDPSSSTSGNAEDLLRVRAYQVWISEIMLQQTRVETVRGYWTDWMKKWPTIEALAKAQPDEVLSAWRGLGYYSRATRIHTAAQKVVNDERLQGLLPNTPEELERQVPGVGRYTAGAISSIVFGHAVPILDGNVARVLSRQMALYANPKAKETTDLLWFAADRLVKKASSTSTTADEESEEITTRSAVPGQWNQALMELGSTVCTPKPNCGECPIRTTCLAYKEGQAAAVEADASRGSAAVTVQDIEDACSICEPLPTADEDESEGSAPVKQADQKDAAVKKGALRQSTLNFGGVTNPGRRSVSIGKQAASEASNVRAKVEAFVKLFPMKATKKQTRQEEVIVCVIRRSSTAQAARPAKSKKSLAQSFEYLIEQRPDTGLLAAMWQFPSLTTVVEDGDARNVVYSSQEPDLAVKFAETILQGVAPQRDAVVSYSVGLGSVSHIFSHLKLLMRIHVVTLEREDRATSPKKRRRFEATASKKVDAKDKTAKNRNFGTAMRHSATSRWASPAEIEAETMGTGMRNCWALVQASATVA